MNLKSVRNITNNIRDAVKDLEAPPMGVDKVPENAIAKLDTSKSVDDEKAIKKYVGFENI